MMVQNFRDLSLLALGPAGVWDLKGSGAVEAFGVCSDFSESLAKLHSFGINIDS